MIGERIKQARQAEGLSIEKLAERVGISANAISKYETGKMTPASDTLLRLARALSIRTEFFLRPPTVSLGAVEYRKKSTLGKKLLAKIEANVLDQVERFLEVIELYHQSPIEAFTISDAVPLKIVSDADIERAAEAIRDAWKLGRNGIPYLADTLEEHGVLVILARGDTSGKFDGLAAQVNSHPVIVVGEDWPGDRQRFTMAHELGHLVLAGRLADTIDVEKACNRFAGAFLVPQEAVTMELGPRRSFIEPAELLALKNEYGLSMYGWVFRALQSGVITQSMFDTISRMFGRRGWRKSEPGEPYPSERPTLFKRLVLRALAEGFISESKAAELMGISTVAFRQQLSIGESHAAAHQ